MNKMPNILIDLYKDNSITYLEKDKCYKKWDQAMKCTETSKNPKDYLNYGMTATLQIKNNYFLCIYKICQVVIKH